MECEHKNMCKVMVISKKDDKLDYHAMLESLNKIVDRTENHEWHEMLICIDCDTVLEHNTVFNPAIAKR